MIVSAELRSQVMKGLGADTMVVKYDPALRMPVVDYGVRSRIRIGRRINPLHLSLYACKELHLERITGPIVIPRVKETETIEYVERVADWLLLNQKSRGDYSVWEIDFPWPPAHLTPPWISALSEAFGALVLVEMGHRKDALLHLRSMLTDFKDGGVGWYVEDKLWFLEYPSANPALVLNGMMHCLLILQECADRLGDATLRRGFCVAYKTLKHDIGLFDASFYTYYDSLKVPADKKYHRIHLGLIRTLYESTADPYFLPWISRWEEYEKWYSIIEPVIFARHLLKISKLLHNDEQFSRNAYQKK